ncbi:putative tricarboxylic transport membrane protein [Salsuginibacillus halophilus]|uniref:Putative tricarboxylic transport membrane protein n=1 Tax=Salsuginibacillus halophilus TaxID=517424 RepID=A0A2P8HL07_9BACI|nr:tripartite tricarboxylate transporter permease [Salsuginibacillus halophilus]PSL46905.1 putative tricarboxylic transport membrane protein [Salsuginibacillus halophilus]
MGEDILTGLLTSLQPGNLIIMALAVIGGIIVGSLPGLSATMGVALLVPLTFGMDPATGLLMLGALYTAAMFGGANSAILLNTPGTPANVATTFDGYPMTQKGQAIKALVTALTASVVGGIIGTLFLLFLSQGLAEFALRFGPPENFWLAVFGLTIIGSLAGNSILKGMIGGTIGLLLALVGIDPVSGQERFTFGVGDLNQGIELIPAMIGFFTIPQMIHLIESNNKYVSKVDDKKGMYKEAFIGVFKRPITLTRSSLIGTFVGMLPGAGGNVASFVAYNETKRFSKNPKELGQGSEYGVVTSESANNATVSSSLIPLLTLGIPGSPVAAVLLGGLLIHGLRPGAELFQASGDIAYTFIVGLIVANILLLIIGLVGTRFFVKALNVPISYLVPVITVFAVMGSYAIRNSFVDVYIMLACGIVGYFLIKGGIHVAPIVLGLILGVIAEQGFVSSVIQSQAEGNLASLFFTRPITLTLIVLTVLSIFTPIWVARQQRKAEGKDD